MISPGGVVRVAPAGGWDRTRVECAARRADIASVSRIRAPVITHGRVRGGAHVWSAAVTASGRLRGDGSPPGSSRPPCGFGDLTVLSLSVRSGRRPFFLPGAHLGRPPGR